MMIVFDEEFWKYAFIVTLALFLVVLGVSLYRYEVKVQQCKEKGGALVELPNEYACVKLERIELK